MTPQSPAQLRSALTTLQGLYASVQRSVSQNAQADNCAYMGPASAAPILQQISSGACTLAHSAALTALGYATACTAAGPHAENASNATIDACDLKYGGSGTVVLSGSSSETCLDPYYLSAVGTQVAAAATAVQEAEFAEEACRVTVKPVMKLAPKVVRMTGDDVGDPFAATPSATATIARGVAGGAVSGGIVGVLIGLVAEAPFAGALIGAMVGGTAGGFVAKG
jgi:hypothetical protein